MKIIKTLLATAIVICLTLTGCSAPSQDTSETEKPIKIALTQDILSFDPMLTSDIFSEAVLRCVYTSLYDLDDNLNLRPKLAKSAVAKDDFTWEVAIHDNVKFHDGSKLTTDDVVFSIERAMKGGRTQKPLEVVDSVKKVSDTVFTIHLKEPYADLMSVFAKAETSIVSKAVVEKEGYDFKTPVGAGPFKLVERVENSKISLERFNDCYLGKAASRYLQFDIIVTEQERTAALLNGDVDMLFSVSSFDCEKLGLSQNVRVLQGNSTKIEYLSLNNHYEPFTKPEVRQAISYAVDRQRITDSVYYGYSQPAKSAIPKGVIGYVETPFEKDVERARELLKSAGYEDGFEVNVIAIDTLRKNTLEHIKLDLAEIGIKLDYTLVTMKEAVDMMTKGEHDAILVGWAYNSDPNSVLPLLFGTGSGKTMNSSNYSNPVVDELLMQGRGEEDLAKRTKIYEEINQILIDDSPIVVLQNPMVLSATLKEIDGVHRNSQGLIQYEALYRK